MRVLSTRIKLYRPAWWDNEEKRDEGVAGQGRRWIRRLFRLDARRDIKQEGRKKNRRR